MYVMLYMYLFIIKLHITVQSGPALLNIMCYSHPASGGSIIVVTKPPDETRQRRYNSSLKTIFTALLEPPNALGSPIHFPITVLLI